jgi:hypothetical protein
MTMEKSKRKPRKDESTNAEYIGADQPTVAKNPLKRWGSEEVELSCFEDVSTTAK